MARIIYGDPVSELIGSIGGVTYQRNSSGTIARLKPRTPNNPSQIQSNQQYKFGQLVSLWATLNLTEKGSWNSLAAAHTKFTPWGDEKTLNGYQWFLSCNINMILAGDPTLKTAPAYASVSPPTQFTLTPAAGSLKLVWPGTFTVIPNHLFIYLTLPVRHASIKLRRSMFLVSVNNTLNAAELNITALFEALANVTWAAFYAGSQTNIIARLITIQDNTGMASQFTSSIAKIG